MTNRTRHLLTSIALAGLAVFLAVVNGVAGAAPAHALSGNGHGPGYLSSDGWWLGTYRLDDGTQGFCLNAGKESPTGHVLDYRDGAALGWYTPAQSAQLAYISRTWAGTSDRLTAAAGQIATWLVAGLGGHTAEEVAARAEGDAGAVLARARQMADEAGRLASTGVHADLVLELAETGAGRLRVELTVDRLSGAEHLKPGAHRAHVTLDGATFEDGTSVADVPSGTDIAIVPTGQDPTVSVSAAATFRALPYGPTIKVAVPRDDAQAVLIAVPATAEAHGDATVSGPSPLPFQPRVETVTSTATAEPGARVADRLTVSVDTGEGLLPSWGVHETEEGLSPVEAVVESTLHGPFAERVQEAPAVPEGAPEACAVETIVTGPGEYETPACELAAAGYYVWTERIRPERTPPDAGGQRLRPWQSAFGVASEVTLAAAPASVSLPSSGPTELAATGASDAVLPAGLAAASALGGTGLVFLGRRRRARRQTPRRATFVPLDEGSRR
ncbi:hypothetical protein [Leifsonia sp. NPDC080035]|uniref:Gram-positive cocci surface proteins LPxTG domain-containing protein n=1 Tax=Leifsonia sp. NPDC080035 TaxID=3143936 RepID=A0AAU7GF58_9MICO